MQNEHCQQATPSHIMSSVSPEELRAARIRALEPRPARAEEPEEAASDRGSDVSSLDSSFDHCYMGTTDDDEAPVLVNSSAGDLTELRAARIRALEPRPARAEEPEEAASDRNSDVSSLDSSFDLCYMGTTDDDEAPVLVNSSAGDLTNSASVSDAGACSTLKEGSVLAEAS